MTNKPLLLSAMAAAALLCATTARAQNLLPKPQSFTAGRGSFGVKTGEFRLVNEAGADADNIYTAHYAAKAAPGARRAIVLRRLDADGQDDEAYQLHITRDSLVLSAASANGFRHAWQTVAQLTTENAVAACDITDKPAYKWRSLMIDVSRHFFGIDFLKKQIDVMAQYKFNRLHLHLTDAAGWRMEIKRYPLLTQIGAWRSERLWKDWNANGNQYADGHTSGAYGGYYTQQQLRQLVRYAAERGITIVPEIEMPGHSEEVLTAYPELSCTHEPYRQADFCPGSIATYDFLENVLKEVMDVFPSEYIHIGGDEAAKKSWDSCPLCQRKMKELGCDKKGLQTYLIARVGKFLNEHGRQLVGWDEVTDGNLAPNTTVMVWRGTEYAHEAIRHGYNVVMSPGAYCYLDGYQDAPFTQPEAIGGYLPLQKVYSYMPGEDLATAERGSIDGVQGNLWCEYVPTPEHAEYMLYPRALAIAEIGWNGTSAKDYREFRLRAIAQTERLRQEGVNAFDLKREYGERKASLSATRHKATGCRVTYNRPYNDAYKAQGETTLTDGNFGGWAFGDKRWQGFIGKDYCMDVTVDLGSRQSFTSVATDFMQSCGPEIYFPGEYRVSVSDNGTDFNEVFRQTYELRKTDTPEFKSIAWKGKAKARYIRVQAKAGYGWVFADEIVVR